VEPMICRSCRAPIKAMTSKRSFGYGSTIYTHINSGEIYCTSEAAPPQIQAVYILTAATPYDGIQLIGVYARPEIVTAEYPEVMWTLEQTGEEIYTAVFPDETVWTLTMKFVTER